MNTKITLYSLFFVLPLLTQAQGENNQWIFGNGAHLSFATGQPVIQSNSTKLNTLEGSTSVSDSKGKLLFYSDGLLVYDRNNQVMPNGTDLKGHKSSTSSAVAVPYPGNKNLYYLFCVDYNMSTDNKGLTYNIIDMSLNEGKGDLIVKNQTLVLPTDEKIAVTKRCDSKGFWVVVHKAFTDSYLSYSITEDGLDLKPVVSIIKSPVGNRPEIGYLKFSPSGKWLVNANTLNEKLEIFNFDKRTGIITLAGEDATKYQNKNSTLVQTYYGVAFSSKEKYLYVSTLDKGEIYQYNLELPMDKIFKKRVLLINMSRSSGAMQLAKNNKIYFADGYESRYLNCIHFPDEAASMVNLRMHDIYFGNNGVTNIGLPTLIETSMNYYNLGQDVIVLNMNNFKLDAKISGGKYLWSTGETTQSIKVSDTGGIYWVDVFDPSSCLYYTDTIRVLVYKNFSAKMPELPTITFCSNSKSDKIPLVSKETGVSFIWINDNTDIGLGESGRGDIPPFTIPYYTDAKSATIKVYPIKNGFIGNFVSFTILITPSPVLNKYNIKTYNYCDENTTELIKFYFLKNTGVTKWYNNNIEIGLQDSGNAAITPFKVQAGNSTLISNITVKSWFNNCPGKDEFFTIYVHPIPVLFPVKDIEICNGSEIPKLQVNTNVANSKIFGYHPLFPDKEVELNSEYLKLIHIPKSDKPFEKQICVFPKYHQCVGEKDTFIYRVNPSPTADFSYTILSSDTGFFNINLLVSNQSKAYSDFKWIINNTIDTSFEDISVPIHANTKNTIELRVDNDYRCISSKTEIIEIPRYIQVFVPNAFSPNKDGKNDVFYLNTIGIRTYKFVILNRWGEQVFEGDNSNDGWDGMYANEEVSDGVYTWVIQGIDMLGKVFTTGGTVTVLR